jgi:hypothetical protein
MELTKAKKEIESDAAKLQCIITDLTICWCHLVISALRDDSYFFKCKCTGLYPIYKTSLLIN